MTDSGHRTVEHTADLALEFWAPDEARLLVQGARAVIELLTEGTPLPTTEPSARPLQLDALDPEDRLVRWLSEVLYLASVEGFLCTDATLELPDGALRGTVYGHADASEHLRTEIKAVTYHDLKLQRSPGEARARVIFDV
ncbi:MAG: archease [Myxococcota bacterium]